MAVRAARCERTFVSIRRGREVAARIEKGMCEMSAQPAQL
jgi:hypothetical protein